MSSKLAAPREVAWGIETDSLGEGDIVQLTRRGLLLLAAAGLAVAAAFAHAGPASAQPEPLGIQLEGGLGNDLLGAGTWLPVVVRLQNRTGSTQRGHIRAGLDSYGARERPAVEQPYVVAPHGTVVASLLVPGQGTSGTLTVEAIGSAAERVASATRSFSFRAGASILVIGDREALPVALSDQTYVDPREEYRSEGVATHARPLLGVPALDDSNDSSGAREILPATALAYGGIRLVVARLGALESAPPDAREALLDWVHTGGRLLVLHAAAAELPSWLPTLDAAADDTLLRHGASRRLGFGWLSLTTADLPGEDESPARFSESPLGLAIASALQSSVSPGDMPSMGVGWTLGHPRIGSLDPNVASKLDPNRVSAFWLAVAGVLLLLYVVAVGPLNFKLLVRRPALALLTTPALAGLCALLLLGVGFMHKGVRNRYRRLELVETTEGATRATTHRFTAAFFSRPSGVSVTFHRPRLGTIQESRRESLPTTSRFALLTGNASDMGTTSRLSGWQQHVARFDVGTWDTVGLHEEGVAPFGRGVTVEAGANGGVVHNASDRWLRSAVVVTAGRTCRVGDVAPGGTARFSGCRWSRRLELDAARYQQALTDPYAFLRYQTYSVDYPPSSRLANLLTNDTEMRDLLGPIVSQAVGSRTMPVLLALLDADRADPFHGNVARELDVALLRVVPALPPSSQWMAPLGGQTAALDGEVAR